MALSGRGIDAWVEVPFAVTTNETPDLSAVDMHTYLNEPSSFWRIQPPSLSENSQSILSQCDCASQRALYLPPSSSASARKITSRASGTLFFRNILTEIAKN